MMGYARGRIVHPRPLTKVHYLRWPAAVIQGQKVVRAKTLTEPPLTVLVPAAGDVRLAIEEIIRDSFAGRTAIYSDMQVLDPAATLCAMEVGDAQS